MKKYILCSVIALGSLSCTDSFLEEKMVSTITQDYFETEQGLEQLIVGTYDALRVTKQYEQGPSTFMSGVDNFTNKTPNRGMYSPSEWNATGRFANWQILCVGRILNHCWDFIRLLIIVTVPYCLFVKERHWVSLLLMRSMQRGL